MAYSLPILLCGAGALMFLASTGLFYWNRLQNEGVSLKPLLNSIHMKLWMTIGLICFFGSFFFLINWMLQRGLDTEVFIRLFHAGRKHPAVFLYAGLGVFILNAALIIMARSIIKTLYRIGRR